jgi:hypothetical protein
LKITALLLSTLIITSAIPSIFAEDLELFTDRDVYSDGQPLYVYGKALSNENLILRLFAPDGTIVIFDQILVDSEGTFNHVLLKWPTASTKFSYGTYTVEAISTTQNGLSKTVDIKFTSSSELVKLPVERRISALVFAPEIAAVDQSFRVFVQVTSDGLLLGGNPNELLGTSHVHTPTNQVVSLSDSFETLHEGLYYVDYTPRQKGTYVFHMVAFSKGTVSHGSAATSVLSQDISGVADQVVKLNSILADTSVELDRLKSEIEGFGSTLEGASENINSGVSSISSSVNNIEEASIQLNSLLFPIVASIGIIVALQIAIFARRR